MMKIAAAVGLVLAPVAAQSTASYIMSGADLNEDGMISKQEAKVWGALQHPAIADSLVLSSFQHQDLDKDNVISLSELENTGEKAKALKVQVIKAGGSAHHTALTVHGSQGNLRKSRSSAASAAVTETKAEAKSDASAASAATAATKAEVKANVAAEVKTVAKGGSSHLLDRVLSEADADKNGALSLQETKAWVSHNMPELARLGLEKEFGKFDNNKDGLLSAAELGKVPVEQLKKEAKAMVAPPQQHALVQEESVKGTDTNDEEHDEMQAVHEAYTEDLKDGQLLEVDMDQDGVITLVDAKEWAAQNMPHVSSDTVEEQFELYDKDEDGVLSREELAAVPQVRQELGLA